MLKVDSSFVAALNDGGQARASCSRRSSASGGRCRCRVVAEGIEVQSQMAALEEMGCEMAQGLPRSAGRERPRP